MKEERNNQVNYHKKKRKNIGIITGASSGMGAETARQMTTYFPDIEELWLIARREDRLLSLKKELEQEKNITVKTIVLDVTDRGKRKGFEQLIKEEQPKVSVLVNSAGYGIIGSFTQGNVQEQTGMVDVNCEALVWMTYVVLPYIKKGGHIIHYASGSAFLPQPYFLVYASTKAFVLHFSYGLRGELKKKHISVTAICPGPVKTEFFNVAQIHEPISPIKKLFLADETKVVKKALKDSKRRKSISTYGFVIKMLHGISHFIPKSWLAYHMNHSSKE